MLGTSSGNDVAEIFKTEFVSAAASSLGQWIVTAAVAGGVLLAAGLVLRTVALPPRPAAAQPTPVALGA
ncbi:hypothetical protein ACOM2C_07585 [Pseudarthrobacter sp. So.54]